MCAATPFSSCSPILISWPMMTSPSESVKRLHAISAPLRKGRTTNTRAGYTALSVVPLTVGLPLDLRVLGFQRVSTGILNERIHVVSTWPSAKTMHTQDGTSRHTREDSERRVPQCLLLSRRSLSRHPNHALTTSPPPPPQGNINILHGGLPCPACPLHHPHNTTNPYKPCTVPSNLC